MISELSERLGVRFGETGQGSAFGAGRVCARKRERATRLLSVAASAALPPRQRGRQRRARAAPPRSARGICGGAANPRSLPFLEEPVDAVCNRPSSNGSQPNDDTC
jgi:hypothetical protein